MKLSLSVKQFAWTIILIATISSCKKNDGTVTPVHQPGKYDNGFFIVNGGWFGHGSGTVSFLKYDDQTLVDSVFETENPGKDLGPETSTMEYGTIVNNKLYLLTTAGGPLVALDASTLKETGRIPGNAGNDFRAMVAIDTTKALVSTVDGIYALNLQSLALGAQVSGISGEVGDMIKAGNYIFALSANDGIDVLNVADYSIAKTIHGAVVGFAISKDGSVWAAGDSSLIRIDPSSLDTQKVKLPFEINGTFGFWHPGSIAASTKQNAVFIAYNGPYTGATSIYKYTIGTPASLEAPFITIATGKELYGSGVTYNPVKDQVVITTVQSGYGANYSINELNFYDAGSASLVTNKSYTGYFFPSIAVFH